MKTLLRLILVLPFIFPQFEATSQITQEGNSNKSTFKKDFLQKRLVPSKSTFCGADTLSYSQYNATSFNYINIVPTGSSPILGGAMYFHVDDTVWVEGVNFYAYASLGNTPVNCRVYYANPTTKLPTGLPIASVSKVLNTGAPFWLAPNLQHVSFTNPIPVTVDFVIAIETTNSTTITMATNDWVSGDGLGKKFSSIKVGSIWSNNINISGVNFDADFYIEPVVSYKMTASFIPGLNSCLGSPGPYGFINTTTFALNPQFSYEAIDQAMDDNFIWDYGDGSAKDTIVNGLNTFAAGSNYFINLESTFNQWTGTCTDNAIISIEESNLNADFQTTQEGRLVRFKDISPEAKEWSWIFGDGSTGSNQQSPSHIYSNYGTFPVRLTVKNEGCTSTKTLIMKLENQNVGIENVSNVEFKMMISPNPSSDYVEVEIEGVINEGAVLNLFNLHGKKISSTALQSNQKMELQRYNRGVYFLNVVNGGITQTKRLVLK